MYKALLVALMGLVFSTAIGVVWAKHESRVLFLELEAEKAARDGLKTQYGQLQLEKSAWAAHSRVEQLAHEKLNMVMPNPEQVVIIRHE